MIQRYNAPYSQSFDKDDNGQYCLYEDVRKIKFDLILTKELLTDSKIHIENMLHAIQTVEWNGAYDEQELKNAQQFLKDNP